MMKIMLKIDITHLGRPELRTGSGIISESPTAEVTIGSTSGAEVSSLPNDNRMLLEGEQRNELFGNNREFTNFEGFSSDESEEVEAENISENKRIRWEKGANSIFMVCFYRSDPTKRGYRKRMMKIWREMGVFEAAEQRLADQTRVIGTNGWLSEAELDEIQRKIK